MAGRPQLTEEQKTERKKILLQKMEPFLRSGLSVRKALIEAQVNNAEFYKYMGEDELFRAEMGRYRQFVAVLLNSALVNHLQSIIRKQNSVDKEGKPIQLSVQEITFMQWCALNSNLSKDEWGERKNIELYDPEAEIQKIKGIIDERSPEEVDHEGK